MHYVILSDSIKFQSCKSDYTISYLANLYKKFQISELCKLCLLPLSFQTMLSIHELQSTMDDDELCDTLAEMKENNPNLFPKMTGTGI